MWEVVKKKSNQVETTLAWMDRLFVDEEITKKIGEAMKKGESFGEEISRLYATPQTPPWHAEGRDISEHLRRMFAGLFGVLRGDHLVNLEEFRCQRIFIPEIQEMEETIGEYAATLQAFIYLHDIGKVETLSFSAPLGSKGSQEGFAQRDRHHPILATVRERAWFQKLWNAFALQYPKASAHELQAKFYDTYEIRAHYFRHAEIGAGNTYLPLCDRVSEAFRLGDRNERLLHFLIRYHMDAMNAPEVIDYLVHRATKDGLDGDDALDVLFAARFLDVTLGCVRYREGTYGVDYQPIFDAFLAEESARPVRRADRRVRIEKKKNEIERKILHEALLDGDAVFHLLGTPFGPERKEMMDTISALVHGEIETADFGSHSREILARVARARMALTQKETS
ncbi:MAG: hypothetical protein WC730_01865 [Patescibacteria group bacterium]|jgi:hypothetical protein